MKIRIGAAFVVTALAFSAPAAIAGNGTSPQAKAAARSDARDFNARRVYRRYPAYPRYSYYPTYYARPYYYRPYPYALPAPFFLGFGYLPYY